MSFEGGPLNVIGITPEYVTGLATQTASSGIPQALGQVWAGSGQSFFGSAGQALTGALASSAINVGLNSVLGTQVVGPQGLSLNSGANFLASTITPYVTSSVAAGINQSINNSLKNAGPFGPVLSNLGTQVVNQIGNSVTNAIFGATNPGAGGGNATNYKMFPGGGDEPPADYGGSSYTLTDVVFSLQPANQGPQAFGDSQSYNLPKSLTTVPFNELTSMPPLAGSATANALKESAMVGGLSKRAFSANIPFSV